MLEWLRRLYRRVVPRVIPMDPESGGTMLLFTLRPSGFLGDNSDVTSLLAERSDPQPGTLPLWRAGEVAADAAFPATISHIILYARARTGEEPTYSDTNIVYGSQLDEDGGVPDNFASVAAFPALSYGTRSVTLALSPTGLPWTYEEVGQLVIGAYTSHTTSEFGVEGYLELADVWVEAYGTQDEPIRQHKFKSGVYRMNLAGVEYTARLTVAEIRSIYEASVALRTTSPSTNLSLSAISLDNLGVIVEEDPVTNSTAAQMLAAIAAV